MLHSCIDFLREVDIHIIYSTLDFFCVAILIAHSIL